MESYKKATREKHRFQTSKGSLSIEQLWDLSLQELDALAVSLEDEHSKSGKKSYLVKSSTKDATTKLKFDIVVDILETLVKEKEELANAKAVKENNKEILNLIAEKKKESLKDKSIEELEKLLQ